MNRNSEGFITWNFSDENELADCLATALESEAGQKFLRECFVKEKEEEYINIWATGVKRLCGQVTEVTEEQAVKAFEMLMRAGEFPPKEQGAAPIAEPVEVVDDRPRGRDGKFLSENQIIWSDMTKYLATHSMEDVNRRRRTDSKFREFCEHNLRAEMDQPIDGAVVPAGEATRKRRDTQALRDFVDAYNKTPIANLRPVAGYVRMAGEQVRVEEFQKLLTAARNAGLL